MQRKAGKGPRPLFDAWRGAARRIRKANRVLLLLDFDGTLVDFKPKPEDVRLDHSTQRLLSHLASNPRISLVFISGRRRADLRRRVSLQRARYWGLHGWEDGADKRLSREASKELLRARKLLTKNVRGLKGVWIEDKRASFVLHFREASPRDARLARAAAPKALKFSGQHLWILRGKKVREFLPAELKGKGATVESLAVGVPAGTLVVYVGDDSTDEAAFAVLHRGLTIHVGYNSCTHARYRVDSPAEVRKFLERLEAELTRRSGTSPGKARKA